MLEALNTAIDAYIALEDDGLGSMCRGDRKLRNIFVDEPETIEFFIFLLMDDIFANNLEVAYGIVAPRKPTSYHDKTCTEVDISLKCWESSGGLKAEFIDEAYLKFEEDKNRKKRKRESFGETKAPEVEMTATISEEPTFNYEDLTQNKFLHIKYKQFKMFVGPLYEEMRKAETLLKRNENEITKLKADLLSVTNERDVFSNKYDERHY